jgi:hypothetical protein
MQHRLSNPEQAQWHNPILQDLSFIKKRMRYPLNKRTLWPALSMGIMVLVMIILLVICFTFWQQGVKRPFLPCLMPLFIISLFCIRILRSFYFIEVKANPFVTDNIKLLQQFLAAQQILVFHHPDAPEVFQIISRPLDGFKGRREVLIFIADDNRILINSHFTTDSNEAVQPVGAAHYKAMAKALKQWMKDRGATAIARF